MLTIEEQTITDLQTDEVIGLFKQMRLVTELGQLGVHGSVTEVEVPIIGIDVAPVFDRWHAKVRIVDARAEIIAAIEEGRVEDSLIEKAKDTIVFFDEKLEKKPHPYWLVSGFSNPSLKLPNVSR